MNAQYFTGSRIGNNLCEAVSFADSDCFADRGKRNFTNFIIKPFFFCSPFSQSNRCYLRLAVGAARDIVVCHRVMSFAAGRFGGNDSFMAGFMSELRNADYVTDSEMILCAGF
jgi:hypothetical protein